MRSERRPQTGLPADVAGDAALVADAQRLIALALKEDLGDGDLTSRACLPAGRTAEAAVLARADGVLAGLWTAGLVYASLGGAVTVAPEAEEGQRVQAGQQVAVLSGAAADMLAGERVALNLVQHLSGVATLTRAFVDAVAGTRAAICDTRKTTPGMRRLEKYAVRCGGGVNHRMGLHDEVLIKDNHLALAGKDVVAVVTDVRRRVGDAVTIEVEVENLDQLRRVLPLPVDRVLLDNMTADQLSRAVAMRDADRPGGKPLLEASGSVTLESVRAVAETGVDRISIGALTHSAPALDIAIEVAAT